MLRSIRSSFRTNIFPYVQTFSPNFTQLRIFQTISSREGRNKNILNKKRDYFYFYFSFTKISVKKRLLRYPFCNNNFIFANKRKTKIVIFIEILVFLFYISQTKTCNKKKIQTKGSERKKEIFVKKFKINAKSKIKVE